MYKPGCEEHYYAHCLRCHRDFVPELDFVLEKDGQIIGSILYSETTLAGEDGTTKDILSFGPLCILPVFQRQGIGKLLMEHSFAKARELADGTLEGKVWRFINSDATESCMDTDAVQLFDAGFPPKEKRR